MPQSSNLSNVIDPAEEKRRLIFGSMMLYSAESIPLRERALEAAILAGLIGSSIDLPLKNGDIQRILRLGIGGIGLRPEVIRDTLQRLIAKGLVEGAEQMRKPVYFLTETGDARTRAGTSEANILFDPVLSEIFTNVDDSLDQNQAATVLKEFICTAFARFGSSIANNLSGRREHFANSVELSVTFDEIAAKRLVPDNCRESLKARCLDVFRHKSLATHRLMLHLTQGYCFAQLLGADRETFNPITEEAFRGSVFYLDTNVLFAGLLPGDKGDAFAEVMGVAKRIGAELRVTRATIDETRHTAAEKLEILNKFVGSIPDEVGERSPDEFVAHFYDLRKENPTLQPSEFLADFDSIADVVRDKWGVVLEEFTEQMLLAELDADVAQMSSAVQSSTVASRGWSKSEPVLRHDVAHLLLVRETRKTNPKAWFLTRDRSLLNAADEIARQSGAQDKPLCFAMLGFLQSISPFVTSLVEDNALANFFSSLLTDQIFVPEKLFDARELALISETHADVMAMPSDQVIVAVDYVKRQVLKGEQYNKEKIPLVALELRKFLSANAEERERALRMLANETSEKYQNARREMIRERTLREEYEMRLQKAEDELETGRLALSAQQSEIDLVKKAQQEEIDRANTRERKRTERDRQIALSAASVIAAFVLWYFGSGLASWGGREFHLSGEGLTKLVLLVGLVKVGFLLFPLLFFIQLVKSQGIRLALTAFVVIAWIYLGGVQSSQTVSVLSSVVTVALYAVLFLPQKREG